MKKLSKRSYRKLKARVLAEAALPGCNIAALSRANPEVCRATVYGWLRKHRQTEKSQTSIALPPKFVEVSVTDTQDLSRHTLEKASLTFKDFSILMEGKLSGVKLVAILKILEERC